MRREFPKRFLKKVSYILQAMDLTFSDYINELWLLTERKMRIKFSVNEKGISNKSIPELIGITDYTGVENLNLLYRKRLIDAYQNVFLLEK